MRRGGRFTSPAICAATPIAAATRCSSWSTTPRPRSWRVVDETEIPEGVHEHHEHGSGRSEAGFRRLAAIYVGVVAMLLAISSLGGGKATREMLSANIRASDSYSFAQAKYLRQTSYELAADQIEAQLTAYPSIPDDAKAAMMALVTRYR